jgi:hypothetical protein
MQRLVVGCTLGVGEGAEGACAERGCGEGEVELGEGFLRGFGLGGFGGGFESRPLLEWWYISIRSDKCVFKRSLSLGRYRWWWRGIR